MATLTRMLLSLRAVVMPRRFAAIDFDSRELRVVLAEWVNGATRIIRLARAEIPEDIDPTDAPALGAFLATSLKEMGISVKSVVMSVPRRQAVLTPLQLPVGTAHEELPGMVQYQVDKELPFRIDEAVVDFAIARHFAADVAADAASPHLDVLVAAVRLPVVEHYKQIAVSAGVKLLRLGLRSNADLRCVRACLGQETPDPLAIVHITASETEIDVMEGRSLAFSRSAIIAVPRSGQSTQTASDQAANALSGEIVRSLQTFQAADRGDPIRRILVAGGTGVEARVSKTLAKRLGVQCERFNPADPLKLADDGSASGFISALGMAIAGDALRTEEMDFLNPKRPRIRHRAREARRWLIPAAVAGVLLIASVAMGTWVSGKRSRVAELRREISELKEKNKQVTALAKPIDAIDRWIDQQRPWAAHLAKLSSVLPSCEHLYVTSIRGTRDGQLNLTVLARQDDVLEDMKRRLRDAEYQFRTDGIATKDNRLGYNYTTSVRIVVKSGKRPDLAKAVFPKRPMDDMSAEMKGDYERSTRPGRRAPRGGRRR